MTNYPPRVPGFEELNWRLVFATAFGAGHSPVAPGTCGTIVGVAIFLLISLIPSELVQIILLTVALMSASLGTVALGEWAERYWEEKDPREFVLDEIAGYLFTVILYHHPNVLWRAIAAFIAFRAMDILKLWPLKKLELIPHGKGILYDDLAAGLYAVILLYALQFTGIFGL